MALSDYNATPASNITIGGINIAEGWQAGNANDAFRRLMADLAAYYGSGGTKFTNAGGSLIFDISGSLLVGSASASIYRAEIKGQYGAQVRSTGGAAFEPLAVWNETGSGDNALVFFKTDPIGTVRGSIDFNRAGTAVRFNTTSDARLKENVVDAAPAGAIIDAIQVRQFDWRESGSHTEYGFVAQELVEHVPDAVKVGDSGDTISDAWAVDYSKLVPLIIKEMQSMRARMNAAGIP